MEIYGHTCKNPGAGFFTLVEKAATFTKRASVKDLVGSFSVSEGY
ncbi:hypothetical protein [Bacillus sp. ISL-45]|nr:hypothetical protein [Bacillus sp. ISL-45]